MRLGWVQHQGGLGRRGAGEHPRPTERLGGFKRPRRGADTGGATGEQSLLTPHEPTSRMVGWQGTQGGDEGAGKPGAEPGR